MDYFGTSYQKNHDVSQGNKQGYLSRASEWWSLSFQILGRGGKIGIHWQVVTRTLFMDDILITKVRYSEWYYYYCWCYCFLLFSLLVCCCYHCLFVCCFNLQIRAFFCLYTHWLWNGTSYICFSILTFELKLYIVMCFIYMRREKIFPILKETLFILSTTIVSQKSCQDAGRCKSSGMLCCIVR